MIPREPRCAVVVVEPGSPRGILVRAPHTALSDDTCVCGRSQGISAGRKEQEGRREVGGTATATVIAAVRVVEHGK